ncbi:uncharacterized protein LOC108436716 isoform X1 [Pygocentrus nattereri]|uniref:uncharacterized protein LOC108436716 isoform X1 n=1 Tax=Pygocentrus nattereri TaxID=42514 RepID=UPI0008148F74|nr:uncharacterized protein LOC108436716 isoform X1 [Pygocentrus nattereri]
MFHKKQIVACFNLLICVIVLSISFWVIQEVNVLKSKLRIIKRDLLLQLAQLQSSSTLKDDILMSDTWEVCQVISQFDLLWFCLNPPNCFEILTCLVVMHFISLCLLDMLETNMTNGYSLRSFSESNRSWLAAHLHRSCTGQHLTSIRVPTHSSVFLTAERSFLKLVAKGDEKPQLRGNVTVIPWTIAAQRGPALATLNNKVIVQEDSYFVVYGQVLFLNPSEVMGHVITRKTSSVAGMEQTITSLFHCLQEMPENNPVNTCYTAGIARLGCQDELELVVPFRPDAQIAMDTESTFFGIIQL